MWVLFGSFFTFSNSSWLDSHNKTRVALENLRWNICRNRIEDQIYFEMLTPASTFTFKVCGCYLVRFSHSPTPRFTQQNSCCIRKSTTKHMQKSDWRSNPPWFTNGYWRCMFVGSSNCGPIECRVVIINLWRFSRNSFRHVSLWC